MKPTNYLEKIIASKQQEIDRLIIETKNHSEHHLNEIMKEDRVASKVFSKALRRSALGVIGEVKRRSPSCGEIRRIEDPSELALQYCRGGASAISVLTDARGFDGSVADLTLVVDRLKSDYPDVPVLRKDFILHPLQLAETVAIGAQAVLLIVSVVGSNLKFLLNEAMRLGLEVLTEVHTAFELEYALEAGAHIIGVNHRNLGSFEMDMGLSQLLRPLIPANVVSVAESGIQDALQAQRMRALGFDAVLVGEALVRSNNAPEFIQQMKAVEYEN